MSDDLFCIYCQIEYERPDSLARHIHKQHPGTYAAESHPLPPENVECRRCGASHIHSGCATNRPRLRENVEEPT